MLNVLRPLILAALLAVPAAAQLRGPLVRPTPILSLASVTECGNRAVPGGRLIGVEMDPQSFVYDLRYMRGREIVDVQVDGKTCRILGRRENM